MNHQHHLESDIVLLDSSNSSSHFMYDNYSATTTTRQYKYYDDGLYEQEQTHLTLIPNNNNIDTSNLTIDLTQSMIIHSLQNIKISNNNNESNNNTNSNTLKNSSEGQQGDSKTTTKQNPTSTNPPTTNDCTIIDLENSPNFNDNMIEDDDNFEYNDELNFLISNFDLKDKQNKFMPYIY